MNKALFLDRDGVINVEKNYVYRIADFEFKHGIFELCREYIDKGFIIIVITNQAGIARGYYSEEDFGILNNWMLEQFTTEGISITKVYFCPHHPEFTGQCECRKPKSGMIYQARDEFNIDLSESVLIGDKESDIEAGRAAGIKSLILVK